jgi:hypothetical protein
MKVLFLDMDGVLNSARWFDVISKLAYRRARGKAKAALRATFTANGDTSDPESVDRFASMIDPDAVKLLNDVIQATGAKVVLSSSWRIVWPYTSVALMLAHVGFIGELIGATPNHVEVEPHARGNEIQAWLSAHPEVTSFAIVDDSDDMAHLLPRLVRTTWAHGLQEEHAQGLISLLSDDHGI